jgi:hypothetical protein
MHPSSANNGFVGMTDYASESFYDLLTEDSEALSDSDSSKGSHHPLRKCFMADTPDGYVESIHEGGDNPRTDPDDEVAGGARVPPHPRMEQLRAR